MISYDCMGDVCPDISSKKKYDAFFEAIRLGMEDGATEAQKDYLKHAKQITYLRCKRFVVTFVPKEVEQLTQLKRLDLLENQFDRLDREILRNIERLTWLEAIGFRDNSLIHLPFCRPFEYKSLENSNLPMISYDCMGDVCPYISSKKKYDAFFEAIRLGMEDGATEAQKDYSKHAKRATLLFCYNLGIDKLPEEIGFLTNMRWLELQGNHIKELPEIIKNLKKLEILNVGRNLLTQFPPRMAQLTKLKKLHFYENQFQAYPDVPSQLKKPKDVYDWGNPYCSRYWL
ncbi:leucine-rich repeat domain-containing protein [bacterium]|nr:leucine-rich repeat domain-containing protein [bacterium]